MRISDWSSDRVLFRSSAGDLRLRSSRTSTNEEGGRAAALETKPDCDQMRRSTIIFLVSAIAFAGFRPFGQVFVQFMIVWQRYSLNGSSSASRRSPVASSRESTRSEEHTSELQSLMRTSY